MCSAVYIKKGHPLLGRTLDLEYDIERELIRVPSERHLEIARLHGGEDRYSFVGVGQDREDTVLMFDGVNSRGLAAAALNFPGDAVYTPTRAEKNGIASYEILPFVLSSCASVAEAAVALYGVGVTDRAYSEDTPPSALHFIFADSCGTLVAEPLEGGLRLYRNRTAVLTNSPALERQLGFIFDEIPAGHSSIERFCRGRELLSQREDAVEVEQDKGASHAFSDMMSILGNLSVPYGCSKRGDGYMQTRYISVMDTVSGEYTLFDLKARSLCSLS